MPKITFISADGVKSTEVDARAGDTLLEIAHDNKIDIEGACEGSMACSTCHVIFSEEDFYRLPPAEEDEEDMLELAFDLQPTSRLACQILIKEEHDGLMVMLPKGTRNLLLG